MRKKFIYVLWALVVGVLLVIALIFTAIAKGWIGYVPPIEELENPNLKFATEIISDDGKMLGTWSLSKENRVFVGYDQLSSNLIRALIATEDERFAEHSGIDNGHRGDFAGISCGTFQKMAHYDDVSVIAYHHDGIFQCFSF